MIVKDTRTNVFVIRDAQSQRVVAVWSHVYEVNRQLFPDEKEIKLRVKIRRGKRGCPILLPKRGSRSSFLTGKTLRRFEFETGLVCKPVERGTLDTMAAGEFGKSWQELTAKERLEILEWIAEG